MNRFQRILLVSAASAALCHCSTKTPTPSEHAVFAWMPDPSDSGYRFVDAGISSTGAAPIPLNAGLPYVAGILNAANGGIGTNLSGATGIVEMDSGIAFTVTPTGSGIMTATGGAINAAATVCTSSQVLTCNGSNVAAFVTQTGDTTCTNAGVCTTTAIQSKTADAFTTQGDTYFYNGSAIKRLGAGTAGYLYESNGTSSNPGYALGIDNSVEGLRIYLTTATPVTTTDVTDAGTLYAGPYRTGYISLYVGSLWTIVPTTEVSLTLSTALDAGASPIAASKNYDVFAYSNSGTVTIELSVAWTSDTARSDALAQQDGVWVKSTDHSRRWVGTLRGSASGFTTDSLAKRYVWNTYNQVARPMAVVETTASWAYSTATIRQANGSAANQLDYVSGDIGTSIAANATCFISGSLITSGGWCLMGVDSTTTNSAQQTGFSNVVSTSDGFELKTSYVGFPGLGRHTITWLEKGDGSGTITWLGTDSDSTTWQAGISGIVWN